MREPEFRVLLPRDIDPRSTPPEGEVCTLTGACMGTTWTVRVVCADKAAQGSLQSAIASTLARIESQMSHFQENSALREFARLPAGQWFALPEEFARVMRAALAVSRLSRGAFDPTLAPAIDAWGFGAGRRFSQSGFVPPADKPVCVFGWQALEMDEGCGLRQRGGVALNLGAIAKGFAVDAVSEYLAAQGFPHHLVEVGGELRGAGMKPDGQPWWVALEPAASDCPLPSTRVALHGLSIATSGNYRRRYLLNGREMQHTIDPLSGAPVAHSLASVTVVHKECMYADAWATAIMVRGAQAGLALAEEQELCALMQWRGSDGHWCEASSRAFKALQS